MTSLFAQLGPQARLVHGDFGKRNVILRPTSQRWEVAAILDWEFALSGTSLVDLGRFLRYESKSRAVAESQFSMGYLNAGGELAVNWRELARWIDLAALCESLTHYDLSNSIVTELTELVRATIGKGEPLLLS